MLANMFENFFNTLKTFDAYKKTALVMLGVAVFVAIYWWCALVLFDATYGGELRVHFLDVGQGDAIVVETPGRKQVLIDAGRGLSIVEPLQEILPQHDKTLDIAVLTHPDADHIGGFIPVFDRYDVSLVFHSFASFDTATAQKVESLLEKEVPDERHIIPVSDRYSFVVDGVRFEILWPLQVSTVTDKNVFSIVLLVQYGDVKVLLTGDAPASVEEKLIQMFPEMLRDVDLLKLGHHGSKTSTSRNFVRHTAPNIAVVSAGESNSYGHPAAEVLHTIESYNAEHPDDALVLYETKHGTVSFCASKREIAPCD